MTRQVVVGILALLVLSLAACQAPPQTPLAAGTGQLLSERSQVFFQKRDQAAEEVVVNDTRAAGAGDEMWTQSRGRALLKFRDLWARLYDDTAFRVADVTPSSIKATLGSGAVLIGEPSQSPERVEIIAGTPPRVRVVLAGTLVMVAYMPAQQVVLVRTFDGKVDVSVLASGQSVQSGGDGAEWVLIGPDGRIETPSQDDVRALARRAGIWDLYHEIEVDAAGFGPPASRIPAERVTMTFIEATITPPASSAPLPPTSTQTPAPACRSGVLYCEDFEDGLANGWVLMDASGKPSSGWKVTREGSDYVFAGEGHQWATLENRSWGDYRVRFRLKLLRGGINLNRLSGANRYVVEFDQNGARLFKVHPNFLAASKTPHELNRWHDVEILGRAGHIQVYVDGDLEIDFVDRDPWQRGAVAFEVWEDSQVQVDDIEVLPAGPEPAPATMVAPTRTPTPRRNPTRTPTRTPTRMPTPAPACRPGVLYCEDFEDGRADGWVLSDPRGNPSSGWKVIREGTNDVFEGEGHQWATLENHSWGDYRVRFRLKLQGGVIHLNYRLGEVGRYFIGFHQEGLYLEKTGGSLTSTANAHSLGTWHTIEISGWGGHIQVSVDGKVELDYTDAKPLRNGTIAFESLDDSSAQVDDIEILPAGPEPTVRPPQPKPQAQPPPQPQPQPQAKPPEVRTPSKPVITDIRTSDIVSIGGLREPECGSSKVVVSARVTSPYRLAKVQMWRSDLATWSEMASQGDDLYVSSQNFKAGNDFRVRAEDEFGDTTETDTLPSPCMRVGTVVNRLSGKCIDVKGSPAVDNEAPLQLWDCEDGWSPTQTDQRWGMTSDGFIQNALSGKCIDVKGSPAVDNGSPLQLWDCEFGSPSTQTDQKWELTADGFIRNQLSGKCIDVMNSSGIDYEAVPGVNNEAALQLWDCEFSQPAAATDQRWQWR